MLAKIEIDAARDSFTIARLAHRESHFMRPATPNSLLAPDDTDSAEANASGRASFADPTPWTTREPLPGHSWLVGDFNGDGKDDILRDITDTTGANVFLSNGSAFVDNGAWTTVGNSLDGWYVGDFNGDGKSDLMRDLAAPDILLSNGASFVHVGTWTGVTRGTDDHGNLGRWTLGDFNGDGKTDIFRNVPGSSGADMYLSTGVTATGFASTGSWTAAGAGSDNQWHIGDFNGDGKDDIFRYITGTGVDVYLSNGTSFVHAGIWTTAADGITDQGLEAPWNVADVNGDGKADIFRYVPGSSGADVFLSNGASFVHAGSWTPAGMGNDSQWHIGDFNGDGTPDLLRQIAGHGADVLV